MSSSFNSHIEHYGCPGQCHAHFERRTGPYGGFFYCRRCQRTIPENAQGEPATPEPERCYACRGLRFKRTRPDGTVTTLCWSPLLHPAYRARVALRRR